MIYLYIGENPTDITEINTISYVVPENLSLYKSIEEKDLPKEKDGNFRKLFYNKSKDTVSAEYESIPPSQEELLKEGLEATKKELQDTKLELSTALVELTEMVTANQKE